MVGALMIIFMAFIFAFKCKFDNVAMEYTCTLFLHLSSEHPLRISQGNANRI